MADTPPLRPGDRSADAEGSAALREASPVRAAALAALGAAAFLLVVLLLGGGVDRGAPGFLRAALGPEVKDAALKRTPAPGVDVTIDDEGYTVERGGSSVSVEAEDTSGEEWERYAHGASRPTDFGTETIVVDGNATEAFLTVRERQGSKTWRWKLETRLVPRLARDGGVFFFDPTRHVDADIALQPAAILDSDGKDITPEGLRWELVLDRGEWWLTLELDDSDLPLPYVIDPAADYGSPLYLSNQTSAVTGSWRLDTAAPGALDTTTTTEVCRNCTGYRLWIPGTMSSTAGTPTTTPTGLGWIVDTAGATGFPAGDWDFTVQTDVPGAFTAGAAVLTVGVWKGTASGGTFTATANLLPPTNGTNNLRPNANPVTTTETFALPKFSLAANERLYVEYWRNQTGGINSAQGPRRQLEFYVNDGIARIAHPPADDTAPTHSLSVVELTNPGGQYFDAASGTHYYNPASGGTFRVDDAASDAGSGVFEVRFPAVSIAGFTHPAANDGSSPYQSNTYTWTTANSTSPGAQAIVAEDDALNTSSPSPQLSVVRDVSGPGAFSLSAPGAGAAIRNGQAVSAAPTDAGAGLASVEFRYCPGATCTFAAGTTIGSPDTSPPFSVTWSGQPADGTYTLLARATDNVGNTTDSAERTVTVDNTDPGAVFDFPAAAAGYNTAAWNAGCAASGFCGTASDASSDVSGVEISIERESSGLYWSGASFSSAGESFLSAALAGPSWWYAFPASSFPADGDYTVHVRATDAAGNVEAGPSRTLTIDTAAPQTTIDSSPADPTSSTSAIFDFSGTEAGSSFECELDGSGFSPCASPRSYSGLGDAAHTFRVRATDAAGNTDATPAAYTWTVDTTAPQTTIDSNPADPTTATGADFDFSADEAGSTFECELDTGGFSACTSPKSYTSLADGNHTFRVRATDPAGNTDATPASFTWTVDTAAPQTTIDAKPADPTNATDADFDFSADEAGSTFECELDAGGFSACTSPKSYTSLSDGSHTVRVRATDPAGNTDATPASFAWTVDTDAPETSIDSSPTDPAAAANATFTFASDESGATFECELDSGGFSACTSPKSYSSLSDGPHTFGVRSTDAAGNTDATPASFTWTVDTAAPQTTIDSNPADPTNATDADFDFSADEAGSTFECELDAGGFSACTSPESYTALADGSHTFRVRATDPAGNTDATPAGYTWTVDTADPTGSLTAPADGAFVSGTAVVSSDSADGGSGVDSVLFERRPGGGGAWTPIDTDTTAPYSVAWDTSALADGDYDLRAVSTDAAGNSFTSATRTVAVDNNSPTVSLTAPGGFVNAADPDPFTVTATSPDGDLTGVELFRCSNASAACAAGSWVSLGIDATAPFGAPWPVDADGNRALRAVATDRASNTGEDVVDVTVDRTPPSGSLTAPGDGSFVSGTVTVSSDSADGVSGVVSAAFERRPSGGGAWTPIDTDTTAPYSVGWDADTLSGDYDIRVVTTDAAGNATTSATRTVTVDNVPPSAPSLALDESSPFAHVSGTEIFLNTSQAGTYDVTATSSDAGSGIDRIGFPGGLDDTSSPYEASYALGDLAGPQTVTAWDLAGNSAGSTFMATSDTTGPAAFALTAPGVGATIANGQDVSASPADAGAGVASVEFRYCAGASCSFAAGTPIGTDASAPFSLAWAGQPADGTYTLVARATDRVGNESVSAERVVTVDNSGPTSSLDVAEGARPDLQWFDGGSDTLYYNPAAGGDFTVTATAGDPAGVQSVDFPAVSETGFAGSALSDAASPFESDVYAFTGANSTAPAAAAVVATDFLGNATIDSLTFVRDMAGPAGGSVSYPDGHDADGQVTVTVDAGTDPLSGVEAASAVLERRTAPLAGGACDPFSGAWSPATSPDTVASGLCAQYRYRVSDRVANETVYGSGSVVQVDLVAPQTTIDAAPADPSADASPSFSFSASETASFECELDGSGFAPCTSPESYAGLADGGHTFRVRATDPAGNPDPTPASHTWTIDTAAPQTSLDSAPADPSGDDSPSFQFSADEPGSSFECELDGGGFSVCTSPHPVGPLADGSHTFRVRALDGAGNADASPASHMWTVDTTPPDTSFNVVPADPSNDPAPTFEFGASEGGSTFECELDGGGFSVCTSPRPLGPLADGSHTLAVRATDSAGNTDATPASYTWAVDATAPAVSVTQPAGFVNAADADPYTVRATSADGDVTSVELFRCSDASAGCAAGTWISLGTDAAAPFEASWPLDADGNRALRAVATDAGSNTGADVVDVTIDRTLPTTTVDSGPSDPSAGAAASFSFSASETATFECELDGSGFAPCTSPENYAGLVEGSHTFRVRATDVAGNVEGAPQAVAWTVDTVEPETAIDVAPADPSGSAAPTFEFSASEPGSTFACELDGSGFGPCTSPESYAGLADGGHTFRVRATDPAGNPDPTPASHTWTIDATPPGGGLADPGTNLRGTVTLVASPSDTGAGVREVEFQLSPAGAGAWTPIAVDSTDPYGADWDTTALADGLYDLRVVVTDNAGNATASAEVEDRRVDNTAPSATMDDPGAYLRATVALTATTADAGSGVASVTFERSPAGAAAWTATPASWDTTAVADGLYNLRVVVSDAAGNSAVAAPVTDRRVDNAPPAVTSTTPADGLTIAAAGSLQLEASEDVAGLANATIDGAPAGGAAVAGSTVTWFGPFADGPHTLAGELEDLAGNRRPIRVHFTVWSLAAADYPYVEKNSYPGAATSLRSASDTATVTMPAGAWAGAPAGDWLVLRVDPAPAAAIPSGFQAAGDMLDVTAYWALAATSVHDFAAPVEIDVDNTVGNVVPATLDGGSWRALAPVAGQSLPAGQADGFYRDGSDVVVLTRHLSFFTLLEDVQAPTVPSGFKGAVKRGKITLSWKAATDAGGIAAYRVYANGGLVRTIGAGARSAAMGEFTISDRRSFQVAAEDVAGNLGAKSFKLKVVPRVARLPLAAAKTALVRRGFKVGKVAHRRSSSVPAGKVVRGSASGLRRAGSKIGLTVSTGSRASSGTDALATPPPPASAAGFPPPPPSASPAPSDPVPASPVPPASAPAPEEQSTHAAAKPQIRPEPLAEHASAGARKPLGYVLLALAFGAAALASLRRLRGLRPAQAVPSGFEPLLLWDARLLRLATGTARRLAGRA